MINPFAESADLRDLDEPSWWRETLPEIESSSLVSHALIETEAESEERKFLETAGLLTVLEL